MIEYGNSTEGSTKSRSARDIRNRAENIPENEKAIPPAVSAAMEDGAHRFGGKEGVAIFKNGDTVRIYDFAARNKRNLAADTTPMAVQDGEGRMALPDVDTVDLSQYNEITLSGAEAKRVQSEFLTWHAKKRNVPLRKTLGDYTYLCSIDDDGIVHCYAKEPSKNIHEDRSNYRDRDSERPDRYVEKYGDRRGVNRGDRAIGKNGRESSETYANDGEEVSREGDSYGRGRREDAPDADRGQEEFRQRLLSQGYYEEGGYMYAPDGSKTYFFFPDKGRRRALPDTTEAIFDPSAIVDRGLPKGKALTVGQAAKLRANQSRERVYSRKEAFEVVQSIPGIDEVKGKSFDEITDKPEKMGDGLLEIYKPTRLWSQEKRRKFDDYLLHCLNIDRMTLEARSKVWTATFTNKIQKTQKSFPKALDNRGKG